jgi:hypothetical protein
MLRVKIKIQNILVQNKEDRSTGFTVVSVSANEGEGILELFRRLAQEYEGLSKIVSYTTGQDAHTPTVVLLNGRFVSPRELSEVTVKECDELTILPLLDGG